MGMENSNSNSMSAKLFVKCDEGIKWYDIDQKIASSEETTEELKMTKNEVKSFEVKANRLFETDCKTYKNIQLNKVGKKGNNSWMEKVISSGTFPDRIAALTVRIQDSPIHQIHHLQQLIAMIKVQGKQQCLLASDTLKILFMEDLLPPNRKLISFDQRGVELRRASSKILILWYFEHLLKLQYHEFVEALKRMSTDTVDKIKERAISVIHYMLSSHPEQENALLELLANKLGDPSKKTASKGLFHLNKLLGEHPRMKMIVVEEIEHLVFRNNISKRAQYYGICFLNQVSLHGEHPKLAAKLIKVYLAFFKACVKKGDIDSKLMSGLLLGVNRAFPHAKEFGVTFSESLNTLYKIIQISHFNVGLQALQLLFRTIDTKSDSDQADRFYRVLYSSLLNSDVTNSAHGMEFLNLVFKAIRKDSSLPRKMAFTKRLLQICHNVQPNLACGILYLISEIAKVDKGILKLGDEPEIEEAKEVKKEDVPQVAAEPKPPQKISELEKFLKSSNVQIIEVVDEDKKKKALKKKLMAMAMDPSTPAPEEVVIVKEEKVLVSRCTDYDPIVARNPRFCGAELTLTYELSLLADHFHPSVALFAETLLNAQSVKYDGNPLKDFTLTRFLDRFVYRNPKVSKKEFKEYKPSGLRNVPVNSSGYLNVKESLIPVEERFFYKFFKAKDESVKVKKDIEEVDDDEFDDIMNNYFKSSNPEVLVDSDDDEMDFASNITAKDSSAKGKRKKGDESSDESDDDEDLDEDDEGDELIQMGAEDEDDLEDMDFDDDDDLQEDDDDDGSLESSIKKKIKGMKKMKGGDMFAPAEEFSQLLEENSEMSLIGPNTFINRDNSNVKQLKWEEKQDRSMRKRENKPRNFKKSKARKF